ncbi:hypothetical protein O0L34_g10526 [Tuta absoluta]|nr:hypothetical protein O0L34_g10526 [Tuta absoluta]
MFDADGMNICVETKKVRELGGGHAQDSCVQTRMRKYKYKGEKFKAEVIPKAPKKKKCMTNGGRGCQNVDKDLCACGSKGEELLELLEGPEIIEARQKICWPDTCKQMEEESRKLANPCANARKVRQQIAQKTFFK